MNATNLMGRLGRAALLVAMLALIGAGTALADTIYVDTGGNDAYNGQSATYQGGTAGPVRTIDRALQLASPGDLISIEAGDYTSEGEVVVDVDNLDFEVRADGSFDTVEITELTVQAAGTAVATAAGTFFELTTAGSQLDPALELVSGALTITDGDLVLPGGVWVERTGAPLSGSPSFAGTVNLVYNGSSDVTAQGEFPQDLNGGLLLVNFAAANVTLTLNETKNVGAVTVNNSATVNGSLDASGAVELNSGSTLDGNLAAASTVTLNAGSSITGDVVADGDVVLNVSSVVGGDLIAGANVTLNGDDAEVTGTLTLPAFDPVGSATHIVGGDGGAAATVGALAINGQTDITEPIDVTGDVLVDALTDVQAVIDVAGSVVADAQLDLNAASTIAGDLTANAAVNVNDATDIEGTLAVNGTVTLGATATTQDVTVIPGGTLAVGAQTLNVERNFIRTGGTFSTAPGGTLAFTDATENSEFRAGPNFEVHNLDFLADQSVSFFQNVNAIESVDIASATTVELGQQTINVVGAATVDNEGTITDSQGGGVIFEHGDATLQGDGIYRRIATVIVPGSGADEYVALGSDVDFTGTLALTQGGIDVGAFDLSPHGANAAVIVNLANANARVEDLGAAGGTFASDTDAAYDLSYINNIGGGTATAQLEWSTDEVVDLAVNAYNGTLDASGRGAGTIAGTVTVDPDDDDASTDTEAVTVTWPANDVVLAGNATIADNATVSISNLLTLGNDSGAYDVDGQIIGGGTIVVDATQVAITGRTDDVADEGEVVDLTLLDGSSATVTDIQAINGNVTVGTNATTATDAELTLALTREAEVTGTVTLDGALFALDTNALVRGDVAVNSGTVDLDANLSVTDGANFTGAADVTYQASDANALVLANVGTFGVNGESVPNVTLSDDVDLTSDVVIGSLFVQDAADDEFISDAGEDVTVNGASTISGGTFFSGAGVFTVSNGGTATLSGDADASNVAVVGSAALAATGNNAPFDLTVADEFTVNGDLDVNDVDVILTGTPFDYDGGAITSDGGFIVMRGGAAQTIENGAALSIPNLTIANASGVTLSTGNGLTITGRLNLENGAFDTDANNAVVTLASGSELQRVLGSLAVDSFDDDVAIQDFISVIYGNGNVAGVIETGNELPATVTNLTINDQTDLNRDVTVRQTLRVEEQLTQDSADEIVTLQSNGTLEVADAGDIEAGALAVQNGGPYDLAYSSATAVGSVNASEFPAGATVSQLTITGSTLGFLSQGNRTIVDVTLDNSTLNLAGNDLSIDGDIALTASALNAGAAAITAAGDIALGENSTVAAGTGDVTLSGDFSWLGTLTSGGADLVFDGGSQQVLTVPAAQTSVPSNMDVELSKDGVSQVVLQAGNLNFATDDPNTPNVDESSDLILDGGVLVTGSNVVVLHQGTVQSGGSLNADQGFDKSGSNSYVVGNVRKTITNDPGANAFAGRVSYPLGDTTGNYSPIDFVFPTETGTGTLFQTDVTASFVTGDPQGSGLPLEDDGITIAGHSDFYWDVQATDDLSSQVTYNVEATSEGFELGNLDAIDRLRLLRRQDGNPSNDWIVAGETYDNFLIDANQIDEDEGAPVVIAQDASLGLRRSGSIFTYGTSEGVTPADLAISGSVLYQGQADNAVAGAVVTASQDGAVVATDTTDAEGAYTLDSLSSGTFTVTADAAGTFEVSGVTNTDALLAVRAFAGLTELSATQREAADVNNDGQVNSTDALLIARFANNMTDSFEAGTFFATSETVTLEDASATDVVLEFAAFGDIDASGSVSPQVASKRSAASSGLAALKAEAVNARIVASSETFEIPVRLAQTADLGAFTLRFEYASDKVSFEGAVSGVEGLKYNEVDGVVTLGWFDATAKNPLAVASGEAFVTLRFTAADGAEGAFDLNVQGELANAQAQVLDEASLQIDAVEFGELPQEFALHGNYPNPFNPATTISFDLPETATVSLDVVDLLGRRVLSVPAQSFQAGAKHAIKIDASELGSGLYVYRLTAEINGETLVQTGKMTLVK